MFILALDGKHKVLKSTIVGVLSSGLLRAGVQAIVGFTSRQGPSHGLIDFGQVEAIALPFSRLASRGRQPQISPGPGKDHRRAARRSRGMVKDLQRIPKCRR